MKDRTKAIVLKRDGGCVICNLYNREETATKPGSDGGGCKPTHSQHSPSEPLGNTDGNTQRNTISEDSVIPSVIPKVIPNGLHVHHESGYYGHKASGVPLQNWPWRNFKQQMVVLCPTHHARRHQETHYSEIKIIRRYLLHRYPEYFDQFDVLGGV